MKIKIFQVDSFTDVPFKGNPAGVCVVDKPFSDMIMQSIAAEMNLSETAFAMAKNKGDIRDQSHFHLRWFTPAIEVDLCGHATLAAARVLFDKYDVIADRIDFATGSGELSVSRLENLVCMNFPIDLTDPVRIPAPVLKALRLEKIVDCRRSRRMRMLLVEVSEPRIVENLKPNFSELLNLGDDFGVAIVTSAGGDTGYDFISRCFAPAVGINEDPVTGASHTVLGPYWAEKLGNKRLKAYQASARGGEMELDVKGDRIDLIGQAVVVIEGQLEL